MPRKRPDPPPTPPAGRRERAAALLLALAAGASAKAAAEQAGCSERTVRRALKRPEFQGKVAALRQQLLDRGAGILARGVARAAAQLRKLSTSANGAKGERNRITAAKAVIELAQRAVEQTTLAQQVAELEQWRRTQESK